MAAWRHSFADVTSPTVEDITNLTDENDMLSDLSDETNTDSNENPDGFTDLVLKFKTQEIVNTFGEVHHGDVLTLKLKGALSDGNRIKGSDQIRIIGNYQPFSPADINQDGIVNMKDFAIFSRYWMLSK
ncbi:MAG: hypothetical protein GY869_05065 [Planctomycetes bacterium]|nr:hypothetical protein [Planctomycetota bacterium]